MNLNIIINWHFCNNKTGLFLRGHWDLEFFIWVFSGLCYDNEQCKNAVIIWTNTTQRIVCEQTRFESALRWLACFVHDITHTWWEQSVFMSLSLSRAWSNETTDRLTPSQRDYAFIYRLNTNKLRIRQWKRINKTGLRAAAGGNTRLFPPSSRKYLPEAKTQAMLRIQVYAKWINSICRNTHYIAMNMSNRSVFESRSHDLTTVCCIISEFKFF